MALIEPAPQDQDGLLAFSAAADELRKRVSKGGLHLDETGCKLIDDLLAIAANAEQQIAEQSERIRFLEDLSITDELTGLFNRRGFAFEFERALARTQRKNESGILLLCDLNRFKEVNDTYGHQAGDAVLCAVADLLRSLTRRSDYVARLGGDEFAILMTNTSPDQANDRAQHLKGEVNRLSVPWQNSRIAVSAAFGVEAYNRSSRSEQLFALADQALYRDKSPTMLKAV